MPQPYVHITLDKPRKLRFRHRDLADLEEQSGKGLLQLMTSTTMHGVRLLLNYGLRHQDTKMTPEKASDLIDVWIEKGGTLAGLNDKILDGLRVAGFWSDRTDTKAPEEEKNESAEVTEEEPSTSASTS